MKRLVSETDDAFERTLLESIKLDELSKPGARETALALALAVRNLPVAEGAASPALSSPAPNVATSGVWKWLGIGALVGGVTGAGAMASYDRARLPAVTTTAASTSNLPNVARPLVGEPEVVAQSPLLAPSFVTHSKAPPVASAQRGAESPARPAVPDSASTLAAEAAAIDRARRALSAGSPSSAIELLDRYDRESATHALAPDALALRIQAEKARGNDAVATKLAEKFLASHPNDPHADRVRRLLSSAPRP